MKTYCGLTTLLVSLVLSFAEVPRPDGELEQQCNELGFTSVACSTCKRFEEIVADESEKRAGSQQVSEKMGHVRMTRFGHYI